MTHVDFPSLKGAGKDRVEIFDDVASFVARFDAVPALRAAKESGESGNDWNGGESLARVLTKCQTGDLSRVPASDKLMSALEDKFAFRSTAFRNIDAMTGGVPNVGAFLAGSPINMRQRRRVEVQETPLVIVADITSSGGVESRDLEKRGAALLALVRLLTARRPVTVYFACAGKPYASGFSSSAVAVRMDTAPLDLARAAHLLGQTGVARMACYDFICAQVGGARGNISWAYDSVDFYRANGVAYWQRALGADELLFLPPVFVEDEAIQKPEKWLADMLKKYGGDTVE
jgi:hypothetical protein